MIPLLLALVACPAGVDPRACDAQAACLRDLATQPEPATPGVDGIARDLALAAHRFERCGLAGWSLAVARAEIVRVVTSTVVLPAVCPACPTCLEPACGSWLDVAVPIAAAAGGLALGAAICR